MLRWVLACALACLPGAALAQQTSSTELPQADSSDEIVVEALRIPREKLPTGVYWNYQSMLGSRISRENAEMFMRCALRSGDTEWLRKVVDGEPNSATARVAQYWITEMHKGCYPPVRRTGLVSPVSPGEISGEGMSRIDRGVLIESALRTFAPDASLTSELTVDPAVRARFQRREGYRNRLRLAEDRDALVFSSCLVQQQPVLATRIFHSVPGSRLERGLTQAIIVQAKRCVGGTSRVTIDPSLARVYIMDAFYRWVVAARGVDSLIPANT